jgi:hypothetical protein
LPVATGTDGPRTEPEPWACQTLGAQVPGKVEARNTKQVFGTPFLSISIAQPSSGVPRPATNVRCRVGIRWRHNALRHSFCSYRVALTGDLPLVSIGATGMLGTLTAHQKPRNSSRSAHMNPYGKFILNMKERLPLEPVVSAAGASLPKFRTSLG